jgi:hypothetical protein
MAEYKQPRFDMFGNKIPVYQCGAEIQRRDGVYGFKGCKNNATQMFQYPSGGSLITMYYCSRHAHRGAKREKEYALSRRPAA